MYLKNIGTEDEGFTFAAQTPSVSRLDGTDVHDEATEGDGSLGAVGLIFSYFMGTDDVEYDQVTSMVGYGVTIDATANPPTVGDPDMENDSEPTGTPPVSANTANGL